MSSRNGFRVQFLLGTNLPVSVTRITADTANCFVRAGVPTTVLFPAVDWWEYRRFLLGRLAPGARLKEAVRLGAHAAGVALFPKRWCGLSDFQVDARVRIRRFWAIPPLSSLEDGVTVAPHTYVIARQLLEVVEKLLVHHERADAAAAAADVRGDRLRVGRGHLRLLRGRGEIVDDAAHLSDLAVVGDKVHAAHERPFIIPKPADGSGGGRDMVYAAPRRAVAARF